MAKYLLKSTLDELEKTGLTEKILKGFIAFDIIVREMMDIMGFVGIHLARTSNGIDLTLDLKSGEKKVVHITYDTKESMFWVLEFNKYAQSDPTDFIECYCYNIATSKLFISLREEKLLSPAE